jgi:hypothetical protein
MKKFSLGVLVVVGLAAYLFWKSRKVATTLVDPATGVFEEEPTTKMLSPLPIFEDPNSNGFNGSIEYANLNPAQLAFAASTFNVPPSTIVRVYYKNGNMYNIEVKA